MNFAAAWRAFCLGFPANGGRADDIICGEAQNLVTEVTRPAELGGRWSGGGVVTGEFVSDDLDVG